MAAGLGPWLLALALGPAALGLSQTGTIDPAIQSQSIEGAGRDHLEIIESNPSVK